MSFPVAIALPNLELGDDEERTLSYLRGRLTHYGKVNETKQHYYDGTFRPRQLDIAVPPQLQDLETVFGWPATVVNTLEERLDFQKWENGEPLGLDEIYADNHMDVESGQTHLEALINGVGFVTIGRGDEDAGEPPILVTSESSAHTTGVYDRRKRRLVAALSQTLDVNGLPEMETLYLENETILFARGGSRGVEILDRDPHRLGRVPVVRFVNHERPSDMLGRSEITRAVRYLTDAAMRTALGMEINREFYTAPQRYVLGATPDQFGVSQDDPEWKKKQAGWTVTMGRLNVLPRDQDGEVPVIGQFPSAAPTPYIEQIRAYALWLSSEAGIPAASLGVHTDNPASADAILREEGRLVKRAERRQTSFGRSHLEVAEIALLWRDGAVDRDAIRAVTPKWRDAATPTRAAAADDATKLVGAGVLPPDSGVTYDRIGISQQDQKRLADDKRRAGMSTLLSRLPSSTEAVPDADAG